MAITTELGGAELQVSAPPAAGSPSSTQLGGRGPLVVHPAEQGASPGQRTQVEGGALQTSLEQAGTTLTERRAATATLQASLSERRSSTLTLVAPATELTVRRAATANAAKTSSERRAGTAAAAATTPVRRSGSVTLAATSTTRRPGTATAAATIQVRRAGGLTLAATNSGRRAGVSTLEATTTVRRSGTVTAAATAATRRAGVATLALAGSGRRAGIALLEARNSARRAGSTDAAKTDAGRRPGLLALEAHPAVRRSGTAAAAKTLQDLRSGTATLEASALVRRSGTADAAVTASARSARILTLAVTASARRSGAADAAKTSAERRSGTLDLYTETPSGTERRAGSVEPEKTETARRSGTVYLTASGGRAGTVDNVFARDERRSGTAYLTRSVRRSGVVDTPMPYRLYLRRFLSDPGTYTQQGGSPPYVSTSLSGAAVSPARAIPSTWSPGTTLATAVAGTLGTGGPRSLSPGVFVSPWLAGGTIEAQEWRLVIDGYRTSGTSSSVFAYLHIMLWRPSTDSFVAFVGDGRGKTVALSASTNGSILTASVLGAQVEAEPGDVLVFNVHICFTNVGSVTAGTHINGDTSFEGFPVTGTATALTVRNAPFIGLNQNLFGEWGYDTTVRRAGTVQKNFFNERRAGLVENEASVSGRRSGIAFLVPAPRRLFFTATIEDRADPAVPPPDPLRLISSGWYSTLTGYGLEPPFRMMPEPGPEIDVGNPNLQGLPGGRRVTNRFFSPPLLFDVAIKAQTWVVKGAYYNFGTAASVAVHLVLTVWRPGVGVVGTLVRDENIAPWGAATLGSCYATIAPQFVGEAVEALAGDRLLAEIGVYANTSLYWQYGISLFTGGVERPEGHNSSNISLARTTGYLGWDQDDIVFQTFEARGRLAGTAQLQPTVVARRSGSVTLNQLTERRAGTVLKNKSGSVRRAGFVAAAAYSAAPRRAGYVALNGAEVLRRRSGFASLAYRSTERLAHTVELFLQRLSERRAGSLFLRNVSSFAAHTSYAWPISGRLARITNPVHTFLADVVDFFQMASAGTTLAETFAAGASSAEIEDSGALNYTLQGTGSSSIEEQSSASAQFQASAGAASVAVLEDQTLTSLEVTREAKTLLVLESKTETAFEVTHAVLDSISSWDDATAWVEVNFSAGTVITLQDESFAMVEVGGIVLDQFEFRSASWAVLVKPYEASTNPTPRTVSGSAALVNQPPRPPPSPVPTVTGPGPRPDGVRATASIVNPAPPRVRGKADKE